MGDGRPTALKIPRENKFQLIILYLAKFPNKLEGGVNMFSNTQRAKTTKPPFLRKPPEDKTKARERKTGDLTSQQR